MATPPGLFEFMTDGWRDEARRFLEREIGARRAALAGPFSVSERFTDAPPHLGFGGDVGAWALRFDGERVEVTGEFEATADVVIEGDYQAALTAAQVVGVASPAGKEFMGRELVQLFGKDAVRMRGRLSDPVAGEVLDLLHDHLARRTMDNPDLRHRAERQGVLGNIVEMEEQGYTVLERAISDEFADDLPHED